jgi:hypothetical protein
VDDDMTSLRKNAFELLEKIPEDKLTFVIQIMQGVNGLYNDDSAEREAAFERLEKIRKKVDDLNYGEELTAYREEKYGHAGVG